MQAITTFKTWWQQRSQQEQRLLAIGAIFVVGAILYYTVITPLQDGVESLRAQTQSNRELVSWMEPRVAALKGQAAPAAVKRIAADELLATLDLAVKQSELSSAVTETSQSSNNGVQIRFKAVAYDRLLVWLVKQREQYGIEVTQLSAQKTATVGLVDVVLVLRVK